MNDPKKYELFISYRRSGGVDYARMIYLELKGRGYNTFFDYNSLRDGKFNESIFKAIDECQYFILVLSNGALDRCMDEDDWVRHEIEYALSKDKTIIPVCPSGNVRGFPEKMPASFDPLRNIQISMLQMDDLFEKSFDKLVEDRFDAKIRKEQIDLSNQSTGSLVHKMMESQIKAQGAAIAAGSEMAVRLIKKPIFWVLLLIFGILVWGLIIWGVMAII
jgi:hypothetical protein